MSGKTESGLKQNLFIQLHYQAWQYTTVSQGVFPIYDTLFYLDRATTNHLCGLSAFGCDIKNLRDLTPRLKHRTLGCIDEFGSTTSPDDQLKLLYAIQRRYPELGVTLHIATHNEEFIELTQRLPDCNTYHYPVKNLPDGAHEYTYRLTLGPADANSLNVATAQKFDPDTIARATEYLASRPTALPSAKAPEFRPIAILTDRVRTRLKQSTRSAHEVLFGKKASWEAAPRGQPKKTEPFLHFFSQDPEFTSHQFWGDSGLPMRGEIEWPDRTHPNIGGWRPFIGGDRRLISKLVLEGPAMSVPAMLERQTMFKELMHHDCYDELKTLQTDIEVMLKFLPLFSSRQHLLLDFNLKLDPIADSSHRSFLSLSEKLEATDAFLEINARILGERFPLTDFRSQLRAIESIHKQAVEVTENLPIESLGFGEARAKVEELYPEVRGQPVCFRTVDGLLRATDPENDSRRDFLQQLLTDLNSAMNSFVLDDQNLAAKVNAILATLPVKGASDWELTPGKISYAANLMLTKATEMAKDSFPEVPLFDVNLKELEAPLRALIPLIKKSFGELDFESHSNWPNSLLIAIYLESLALQENPITKFTATLRSYDSVDLHQVANSIDKLSRELFSPLILDLSRYGYHLSESDIARIPENTEVIAQIWGKESADSLTKAAELGNLTHWKEVKDALASGNPASMLNQVSAIYKQHFKALADEFQALSIKQRAIAKYSSWWNYGDEERPLRLFLKEKALSKAKFDDVARAYFQHTGGLDSALAKEWRSSNTPQTRRSVEEAIRLSPFTAELKAAFAAYDSQLAALKAYCTKYSLKVGKELSFDSVKRALDGRFDTLATSGWMRGHAHQSADIRTIRYDLLSACSIALFARHMRLEGFCPVEFSATGELRLQQLKNMFDESANCIPVDVAADFANRFQVNSGPNMSGKTYLKKGVFAGLGCMNSTGMFPAKLAIVPAYYRGLYIDRVGGKKERLLSAAGHEFKRQQEFLNALRKPGTGWTGMDEPWTTLSPRYQEAFCFAVNWETLSRGDYVMLSLHHHTFIDFMQRFDPAVSVWHPAYTIDSGGLIHFDRHRTRGHAPSEAIPVAKALGLDPMLIKYAEEMG